MLELIQKIALFPGQGMFTLSLAVAGYWIHKRRLWASVLYMACASMIINMYMKCYFKVPLAPHLGEGYAFPSGHFQLTFVIWVWATYQLRLKWLYILTPLMLVLYGWGVVVNGYHTWADVGAAVVSGTVIVALGMVWEKTHARLFQSPKLNWVYTLRQYVLSGLLIGGYYNTYHYVGSIYHLSLLGVYSAASGLIMGGAIRTSVRLREGNLIAERAYGIIATKLILGFGMAGGIYFYGLKALGFSLKDPQTVAMFFTFIGIWVAVGVDWITHKFCSGQRK